MLFTSSKEFEEYVDEFIEKSDVYGSNYYIVMKAAYTEEEIRDMPYSLELLEFEGDYEGYVWQNDWYEGQEFIDLYCILTDDDILNLLEER